MKQEAKKQEVWLLRIFDVLQKVNEQRHLYSIRTAFIALMPVMIVGAYATVINNMPFPAYHDFMESIFGERWRSFGALAFNSTTQVVALFVSFQVSANLALWYNTKRRKQIHGGICGMVGLGAYIALSIPVTAANALPFDVDGVIGLFVALVISIVTGEAFIHLCGRKKTVDMLSDDPNVAVPQSFASVMPAIVVLFCAAGARMALVCAGVEAGLLDIVNNALRAPFQNSAGNVSTGFLYNLFSHLMWMFGIHGNNVLDGVAQSVFVPALVANATAAAAGMTPPYLVTKTMFDAFVYMGGSGTTLALLIALVLFGYGPSHRTLMRFALPNSLFNINEPLIFGIPVVLNPVYAIPFVLTPMAMLASTSIFMRLGVVPYTVAEVNWATPVFVSGYIATGGSVIGALLQGVNLCLAVLIYAPFVRLSEEMAQMRFERAYKDLAEIVLAEYSVSARQLIGREDEVGAVARSLANQLEDAVSEGRMYLNYQPIVDARSRTLHSVEALLRWNHPTHGFINPMIIVALAEETGRIDELGLWVMSEAIAQRAAWTRQGLGDFHVAVNVSTQQLNAPDFHVRVLDLLRKYDVPAHQLQVEITETVALDENLATGDNLRLLHEAGTSIAMDDFGVGHSSLLYLRTHPITTLKIDASLSREVTKNPANLEIIATIYDLCRLFKVDTIVEFVDNEEQLEKLMSIGTFLMQGYLFSKPLKGDELSAFVGKLEREAVQANESEPSGGEAI